MIIAIDGPAGVGKSSAAKILSRILKYEYIDTGAMFRAIALKSINTNCDVNNIDSLNDMLNDTEIDFKCGHIYLDNEIVDSEIRTEKVTKISSKIAKLKEVRNKLVDIQRSLAYNNNAILDGRDIGTVVFPNADFKFFLTASPEERGLRRYKELKEKNIEVNLQSIIEDINKRDFNDSTRKFAPLKKAEDAIVIDTTNITLDGVVNKMVEIILEDN